MDPTDKLNILLYISSPNQFRDKTNIDLSRVLIDIEECINEGAVLDKESYSWYFKSGRRVPILQALVLGCDYTIIELLKKYWWDNSYKFKYYHTCNNLKICPGFTGDGLSFLDCDISVFLHELYGNNEYRQIKKYAEIFNVILIKNHKLRHNYLVNYRYV